MNLIGILHKYLLQWQDWWFGSNIVLIQNKLLTIFCNNGDWSLWNGHSVFMQSNCIVVYNKSLIVAKLCCLTSRSHLYKFFENNNSVHLNNHIWYYLWKRCDSFMSFWLMFSLCTSLLHAVNKIKVCFASAKPGLCCIYPTALLYATFSYNCQGYIETPLITIFITNGIHHRHAQVPPKYSASGLILGLRPAN